MLRAGDFIERDKTGNWFDTYITHKVHQGVIVYPGRVDIDHAWAYLPDLARAAVALAERRDTLGRFVSIGFPGHTFSAVALKQRAEAILGRPVRLKTLPWPFMRIGSVFSPAMREVLEMRYLWDVPHRIDPGSFERVQPDFQPTSLDDVLRDVWQATLSPVTDTSPRLAHRD